MSCTTPSPTTRAAMQAANFEWLSEGKRHIPKSMARAPRCFVIDPVAHRRGQTFSDAGNILKRMPRVTFGAVAAAAPE
ncbi:hypothetical protein GCM10011614_11230 [Novosphingobium colocasiae]|uniref:Uncharacterized protein n=1 Tax=Novosphingobium colocasiae TaxID=1256513 RepID=A0A918PC32_9SPHN|nr:hypothetical protein GCM10011614_11230 [Novosphingobium colocasiae]